MFFLLGKLLAILSGLLDDTGQITFPITDQPPKLRLEPVEIKKFNVLAKVTKSHLVEKHIILLGVAEGNDGLAIIKQQTTL